PGPQIGTPQVIEPGTPGDRERCLCDHPHDQGNPRPLLRATPPGAAVVRRGGPAPGVPHRSVAQGGRPLPGGHRLPITRQTDTDARESHRSRTEITRKCGTAPPPSGIPRRTRPSGPAPPALPETVP